MMSSSSIAVFVTAAVFGLIYGLSFVAQQRTVFRSKQLNRFRITLFFCLRIAILCAAFYSLLRLQGRISILALLTFITTFWLSVLTQQKGT